MNGLKAEPDMKMDADAITPSGSGYMDDDFYEDLGELQLPQKGADKGIWLTRVPKWLYEAVSKWEDLPGGNDDDQVVIGDVVAFQDPANPGTLSKTQPMRLFFNHGQKHEHLPQAFELKPTSASQDVLANTYIFTEKDLPGYKPNGLGQGKMGASGGFGIQDPKARIQKRGRYRKAIPKQTTMIGHAAREYTANPLNTKEYVEFNRQRTRKAILGSEEKTNIDVNMHDTTMGTRVQNSFKNFIKSNTPARSQTNKAARIPKNELIDLLHTCFDQFAYWPMKSLKQKTRQPEAYLKEVLPDIAILIKSGTFASNWKRHGMYDERGNLAQDGPPPDDMDDEDGMEYEDMLT
ncbi:hypothetical protein K491DRAFT_686040 [Lophiostoma macrostomum CBS 122681]|uniref:Transcription initiation factor IIF subunit beta n=1 Tax=Lophiostoma macrostomum CBS 122681 TaxID=1314788 RepID=A0A6A6TS31_9PLEO|nr:hypothetical protein K491DRAFT_686040 [Lophiostoma macrostomum CBS 122681]